MQVQDDTVTIDESIIERGRMARAFINESAEDGEQPISDELIMRAAVAYGMLERHGWLQKLDDLDEPHAIALIAHGFSDAPPSTPQRAKLFAAKLDRGA